MSIESRLDEIKRAARDAAVSQSLYREIETLVAVARAANIAVHEYESHGGKGTHQECDCGTACFVARDLSNVKAALRALESGGEE